jgi:hypothetical protein
MVNQNRFSPSSKALATVLKCGRCAAFEEETGDLH